MTYAQGRSCCDADSHIMELPDFLSSHADPDMRDRIPRISVSSGGRLSVGLEQLARRGSHSPERVAELLALGDQLIAGPKGYLALGAFHAGERRAALDLLGFERQLVFSTFTAGIAFAPSLPVDVRYGTARAHNRG